MAHLAHLIWRASRHKGTGQGLLPWLASLALATLVIGCGGGGTDTAGNGVGVGGTGAAAGPVSGYGSVIVNDVRFDFSHATFTTEDAADGDDDEVLGASLAAAARPVEFGTMLSITSDTISNDGSYDLATASRIVLVSAIRGPIEAKSGNTLTVLGQTVDVDAGTWYEAGHDLANLNLGNKVVVYGDYNPVSGHYKATRVEYRNALAFYKVRGAVSSLDLGNSTFMLGALKVNFASARGRANLHLTDGQLVRVRIFANTPLSNGAYAAQVVAPIATSLDNGVQTRLAGVATEVSGSTKRLVINGTTVDFSRITLTATPGDDDRLEVEGTVQNGVLVATKLTSKPQTDKVRLIGPITPVTNVGTSGSFRLKGDVTVTWDTASTQFDGGLLAASMSSAGLLVDVEGNRSSTNQTTITATRIRPALR